LSIGLVGLSTDQSFQLMLRKKKKLKKEKKKGKSC